MIRFEHDQIEGKICEIELNPNCDTDRDVGQGLLVGIRQINTAEKLVEWLRHLYAYKYVETFCEGKFVLDIGCGTGYGINELAAKAFLASGVDIWKYGIHYCNENYGKKTSFVRAPGFRLPFKNNSFDLVVSFQVIEHIEPKLVKFYLEEIKRVVKTDGILIVSTPNKKLRLLPFQKPWNKDHRKEYDDRELKSLLKTVFEKVEVQGLFATQDAYMIEYNRAKRNPFSVYLTSPISTKAHKILPSYFINNFHFPLIGKKNIGKIQKNKTKFDISLKDFTTSQENLQNCIDLYGLCKKS